MKPYLFFLVLGFCAQATEPRFSGVLISGNDVHVVLINPESGRSSGWIQSGVTFEGYTVKQYNSRGSQLLVEFKGKEHLLPLVGAPRIASVPTAILNIAGRQYEIFADAKEEKDRVLIFRGNVKGACGDVLSFACQELLVDTKHDAMRIMGTVKRPAKASRHGEESVGVEFRVGRWLRPE
jgi:hypothetical protein